MKTAYLHKTAKYIWQLNHNDISCSIKWTIIIKIGGRSNPFLCKLCLTKNFASLILLMTRICYIINQSLSANAHI